MIVRPDGSEPGRHERPSRPAGFELTIASVVSIAAIIVVMFPVVQNWRERPKDSFPLSYYPMFTASRGEVARVTYLVGVDPDGHQQPLHYTFVGKGGLNQVRRQINRMKDEGRADKLCEEVARKLARRKSKRYRNMTEVRVVTGHFNFNDYFRAGKKAPLKEIVHATCRVERQGAIASELDSDSDPDPLPEVQSDEP